MEPSTVPDDVARALASRGLVPTGRRGAFGWLARREGGGLVELVGPGGDSGGGRDGRGDDEGQDAGRRDDDGRGDTRTEDARRYGRRGVGWRGDAAGRCDGRGVGWRGDAAGRCDGRGHDGRGDDERGYDDGTAARLAALRDDHLVPVRDVVPLAGGRCALLVDHVPGPSLATLRRVRVPLADGEAATVVVPLAGTLDALHAAGLGYGPLGADDVLFGPDGRPLLAPPGPACAVPDGGDVRRLLTTVLGAMTPPAAPVAVTTSADPVAPSGRLPLIASVDSVALATCVDPVASAVSAVSAASADPAGPPASADPAGLPVSADGADDDTGWTGPEAWVDDGPDLRPVLEELVASGCSSGERVARACLDTVVPEAVRLPDAGALARAHLLAPGRDRSGDDRSAGRGGLPPRRGRGGRAAVDRSPAPGSPRPAGMWRIADGPAGRDRRGALLRPAERATVPDRAAASRSAGRRVVRRARRRHRLVGGALALVALVVLAAAVLRPADAVLAQAARGGSGGAAEGPAAGRAVGGAPAGDGPAAAAVEDRAAGDSRTGDSATGGSPAGAGRTGAGPGGGGPTGGTATRGASPVPSTVPDAVPDAIPDPVRDRTAPVPAAAALTRQRAAALASGDPARLAAVDLAGGPALAADEALLAGMGTDRLVGLGADVQATEALAAGTDEARVSVTSAMSPYTRVTASGAETAVAGTSPRTVVLHLRWTADGWRVRDVSDPPGGPATAGPPTPP